MAWRPESALRAYLKARLPNSWCLPPSSGGRFRSQHRKSRSTPPSPRWKFPTLLPGLQNVVCGDNSTGAAIASVWQRLLSRADVRVDENFFDAGGTLCSSCACMTHCAHIRAALTIADLFQYPTIASLAAYLSERHQPETALSAVAAEDVAFPANAAQLLEGLRSRQL